MKRTYELSFIADPRLADEDVVALTEEYKAMLTSGGATITKEESWGRRKLAYPIKKFTEGKYVFLYFEADTAPNIAEAEQRLEQSDKILRYLTVRTDRDLKRAATKGGKRKTRSGTGGKVPAASSDAS